MKSNWTEKDQRIAMACVTALCNNPPQRQEEFELLLEGGKKVKWVGKDGVDAATRYVDTFPGAVVIATRYPRNVVKVGLPKNIDSGL